MPLLEHNLLEEKSEAEELKPVGVPPAEVAPAQPEAPAPEPSPSESAEPDESGGEPSAPPASESPAEQEGTPPSGQQPGGGEPESSAAAPADDLAVRSQRAVDLLDRIVEARGGDAFARFGTDNGRGIEGRSIAEWSRLFESGGLAALATKGDDGRRAFDEAEGLVLDAAGKAGLLSSNLEDIDNGPVWLPDFGLVKDRKDLDDARAWDSARRDEQTDIVRKIDFLKRFSKADDPNAGFYGASLDQLRAVALGSAVRNRGDRKMQEGWDDFVKQVNVRYEREREGRGIGQKAADAFRAGMGDIGDMGERLYIIAAYGGDRSRDSKFAERMREVTRDEERRGVYLPATVASLSDIRKDHLAGDIGAYVIENICRLAPQTAIQVGLTYATGGAASAAMAGASMAARQAVVKGAVTAINLATTIALDAADTAGQMVQENDARGRDDLLDIGEWLALGGAYVLADMPSPVFRMAQRAGVGRAARSAGERALSEVKWIYSPGSWGKTLLNGAKESGKAFLGEAVTEGPMQQGASYIWNALANGSPGFKSQGEDDVTYGSAFMNMLDQAVAAGLSAGAAGVVGNVAAAKRQAHRYAQTSEWGKRHDGIEHALLSNLRDMGIDTRFQSLSACDQDKVQAYVRNHCVSRDLEAKVRYLEGLLEPGRIAANEAERKLLDDRKGTERRLQNLRFVRTEIAKNNADIRNWLHDKANGDHSVAAAWLEAYMASRPALSMDDVKTTGVSSLRGDQMNHSLNDALAEINRREREDEGEGGKKIREFGYDFDYPDVLPSYGEDEDADSSHAIRFEENLTDEGKLSVRVWNAADPFRAPSNFCTEFVVGENADSPKDARRKAGEAADLLARWFDALKEHDAPVLKAAQDHLARNGREGQDVVLYSSDLEMMSTLRRLGADGRAIAQAILREHRQQDGITIPLGNGKSVVLVNRERNTTPADLFATLDHETFHADYVAFIESGMQDPALLEELGIAKPKSPAEDASEDAKARYSEDLKKWRADAEKRLSVAFLGLDVDPKTGKERDWRSVTEAEIESAEEDIACTASVAAEGIGGSPFTYATHPFRAARMAVYKARHPKLDDYLGRFLARRFGGDVSEDAKADFISRVHQRASALRSETRDETGKVVSSASEVPNTVRNAPTDPSVGETTFVNVLRSKTNAEREKTGVSGRLQMADADALIEKNIDDTWDLMRGKRVLSLDPEKRARIEKERAEREQAEADERRAKNQAEIDARQQALQQALQRHREQADEDADLRARADAQDAAEKAEEQARQRHTERENAAVVERVKAKRAARREQMRRSLEERASRTKSDRVNKIYWRFEDFLDKYHPDVMDDEAWQKGNAEQLARLEKGLRENNPQIVLEATEALRKNLRGRPSPTTEARAREVAEREQAEADRREQEAIRRENEAEEAGLRALDEQEEAQRQDERAEGERAAQGAAEAEAAEHADNPLAVEADRKEAEAARLEAVAKEKESKAKRGGKDKTAAEKARRLAGRARKEAKAARAAQLGERTTSAYWANRPILDREDARDRRTARRRDEALQAEYDRLIAAGASEAQARRQANMAVTPARLNSRNVAGRPAVVAQNPGRFPIHEALEGKTLFGEVRPGDAAWEFVSDMTSREAREAGLADRLLPKERGNRGLDYVVESLVESSPYLAARYGEDGDSGIKAGELVNEFLAENREIDDLVSDGALSEQERHNEDEEIEANRRRLGFYDERYEGMDDPERLAHIRDEVEARVKGMAPALPDEAAEAAAQDKAALDAQEELEAESPEAVQARRDSEAERAQQRFQESLVAQQEDEFYGDDYLAESAPGVRSSGAETEAEGVAEPGIDAHLDAVQVPADRREEAKKAIQQELFSIDEMSKDGFLYPRSPEAEAAKPRKKISMKKPAPAPTVYTAEEKKRAFRALNSEEYAADNPADLALAKKMLDEGLPVSSVISELYSGQRFEWPIQGFRIARPADVAALAQMLRSPYQESSKTVFVDKNGVVLAARVNSLGCLDACPVHPAVELANAPAGTAGVYFSHNHPSGDPAPSPQDIRITRALLDACEMMGFRLIDSIVTDGQSFHSMRAHGDVDFLADPTAKQRKGAKAPGKTAPVFGSGSTVADWEAVSADDRFDVERAEDGRMIAQRFRSLDKDSAFVVCLDKKFKVAGVTKVSPEELAKPGAWKHLVRLAQNERAASFWMLVAGDAGVDVASVSRYEADAVTGKPLVDVFVPDEYGIVESLRIRARLDQDIRTGGIDVPAKVAARFKLTQDSVERWVAEHPAPRMEESSERDSVFGAEPARIRSRSATSAEAAELEAGKKIRVFRAMQLIDGKLYPPMAAVVDGALVEPTEFGKWYVADERPDLADENGRFKLDKGNGSSIKAAYNPYWHTSRSPLNDQFSSAWKRTNLVTVECEVPASELTSGYRAEKAKDAVGEMDWHSGPVSSKLAKVGLKRKVILSRYCKVLRVIPDAEVADAVSRMLKGKGISIPADVVTPSLRKELLARGVKVTPTKNVADVFAWKQLDRKVDESTRMEFQADPFTRDWTVWSEPDYIAALPVHTLPQMYPISDRTDNNSVEKALQSLFARFGEVTNEDTEEKVVFNRGDAGKMMMQSGVDMRTFGPHLKHLFEKSVLAWTEPERSMNEHKFHENVEQYRQYVAKFDGYTDVGHGIAGAAFVRFTVRVMNTGRHGVHAASISDISVIQKQKGGPQPVPARKLGGIGDLALRDKTLAKFLSKGKNEFSEPESRVRSRGGLSLDDVYGVRTRDVVEQIKLRRHEYDYDPQKRHVCDMVEEAFAKAQADPAWLKSVVDRALAPVKPGDQPPAFNTQEQGALMLDMHLRAEAADVAATRLAALKAAGASVEEIAAANARYAELEAARFAMEEAYIRQGKALSDAMNQRKAAFDKATGSFAGLMEAFEQATGRKPGASERARIRDAWREIERLRKALADAIRDVGNRDFDAAMAAIMSLDLDDLLRRRRSGPGKPGKAGAKGEADRSAWPKTREELEALAKERAKDLDLDRDDPDAMRLLLRPFVRWVGKCLLNLDVEAGREMGAPEAFRSALGDVCRSVLGEDFADWSDRTWGDIYSNYGNVTPASTDELKVRISQMTALQRLVSQLQDLENRMRPLKTGPQRVAMESQAEALRAEINAKMKELNLPIPEGADPSRFIKSPQEIQKEAMRKAIERLERAIRDGVPFPKNADPIALDEEGQALRTLLEDLRKQYKEAFPLSDAEIVKRIVKAYEKAEERAQRELDAALAGNFRGAPAETRERMLRENDLRVQVMRERVAMLREARQELEDAAGPEAYYSEWSKAVRRAVQSKLNAAQRYHDWIANPSEFEKWQRKRQNKLDVGDDPAVKDAQKKLDDARQAWFKTLDDLAWSDMNWLEKTWETLVGVSDISKRFIASADLSSIGIQAAVAAILRDPSLGWRTAKDALWAKGGKGFAFSEEKCRELLEKMQNDPEWHTVVDLMGIRISDWHADSGDFGEEYRKAGIAARRGLGISKMLNNNKILRFGDRTYTMPLNLIRFAYAKQMIAHLTKMYGEAYLSTEQGRKDLKLLGRVVNMETGRGDWFTKNAAGSFVSKILWAPGKFAGQLQTMFLPVTLLLNDNRASARTRAMVFRQCWLRPLAGWAILVMFLRAIAHLLGDDDRRDEIGDFMETNPLNPMFGRVNLGGRRFSLSAGMESYISVATRVAMMKTASKYDEEKRLADPTGPIVNTLSNKFNPPVGIAWRLARRKDVDGTKLDNPGAVAYFLFKNLCMPITGTDFTKTALDLKPGEFLKREDEEARTGLLHKAVLLPLSFLGVSSNRYGWDAREADVANFDRLAKEFKALAKVYENKGGAYSANEIAKAREGILNLRGDPVLGLYAREWTRGKELRDRLRRIENAIKAEGKERKPDKERLAQLEQLRGETLTAFHRLYHPQFARDAR